jgi:hypothetical protein
MAIFESTGKPKRYLQCWVCVVYHITVGVVVYLFHYSAGFVGDAPGCADLVGDYIEAVRTLGEGRGGVAQGVFKALQ